MEDDGFEEFMSWMFFNDMEKDRKEDQEEENKFYCESCEEEITEEEYKKHNKMCKKCFQ